MMVKQDRLSIIDAIEKASEAELQELSRISQALKNLPPYQGGSKAPANDPDKPDQDGSGMVISKRLRQRSAAPGQQTQDSLSQGKSQRIQKSPDIEDYKGRKGVSTGSEDNDMPSEEPNSSYDKNNLGRKKPASQQRPQDLAYSPEINSYKNTDLSEGIRTYADVMSVQGIPLSSQPGLKPSRKPRVIQARKAEASNDNHISPGRDASGRFVSRDKAEEANKTRQQKLSQKEQEKLQAGFFSRLGSMLSGGGKGDSHVDAEGAELVGGAAVGGPIWTLGKGVFDLGKSVSDNVVSLQQWMNDRQEGKELAAPSPAKVHPPVIAQPPAPPEMGEKSSLLTFNKAKADKGIEATNQQTKVIAANDERIIDELEGIRLAIKRQRDGADGGGLLSKLLGDRFGRKGRRGKAAKAGRNSRRRAGGSADVSLPEKKGGKTQKPGRKPEVKAKSPRAGVAGRLKALFTSPAALKTAGTVAAGGALTTAGAKVATEAATKAAATPAVAKTTAAAAKAATAPTAAKVTTPLAEEAGQTLAQKGVAETGEKLGAKGALKAGGKLGAKAVLKAIPILGTALSVGWDAYDGINDDEGQRATFNTGEGEDVSNRQKSAYTMANVVNMGGLVSGGAGLLASGARMIGMDKVADSLTFDTGSIAKGLDSGMAAVGDAIAKVKSSYEDKGDQIAAAVSDGTEKTVTAINRLGSQVQGGEWGHDNVGAAGQSVSDYNAVQANNISPDLNVGGKNAGVRSFRNNNFGNLNYVGQEGARLEDPNGKGEARFAKFNTPEEGFRALAQQLTLYSNGQSKATGGRKLNSVEDIIKVYAPESENNTQKYISSLSEKIGVAPGQQLDMTNPEVMTQMIRGIATIEGGNPQVTDQFIKDSIGNHEAGKWVGGKFSDESLKVVNEERAKKGLAPVAQNSLYSTGAKAITQPGQAQAITPSPVSAPGTPAITAPAAPAITAPAAALAGSQIKTGVDKAVQEQATDNGIKGLAKNRPDAGLTTPKTEHASAERVREERNKAEAAKNVSATPGASGVWDATKSAVSAGAGAVMDASRELDGALQEKLTQYNVRGMAKNRPSAELTLPAGISLPSSLAQAALPPSEIARRSRASSTNPKPNPNPKPKPEPDTGAPETSAAAAAMQAAGVTYGAESSIQDSAVASGEGQAITAASTSRAAPEDSMFDKALGGAVDGLKAVGSSILPAMSDTINQTVSGFSGNQLIGDVMDAAGLADPTIQRAIAPITSKAGTWLDNGMDQVKDMSTSLLTGPASVTTPAMTQQQSSLAIPASMPVVHDLAASGVRPALSSDAANHDLDILKELKNLGVTLEQLLGVSKQKGDAQPERVVHSAQPAPRKAASFSVGDDKALTELLRDE